MSKRKKCFSPIGDDWAEGTIDAARAAGESLGMKMSVNAMAAFKTITWVGMPKYYDDRFSKIDTLVGQLENSDYSEHERGLLKLRAKMIAKRLKKIFKPKSHPL